jgi:hypothetical protein
VEVRIEPVARRIKPLHAVFLERVVQRAFSKLDAFDQRFQARIGVGAGLRRHRIQRALQIVGDVEHVARKAGDAISPRILHLFCGAFTQVLHLGQRAQHLVTRVGRFPRQRLGRGRLGVVGHDVGL